jgi:hypothetical protein
VTPSLDPSVTVTLKPVADGAEYCVAKLPSLEKSRLLCMYDCRSDRAAARASPSVVAKIGIRSPALSAVARVSWLMVGTIGLLS